MSASIPTYSHDVNDATKPWLLQYFDYDPSGSAPSGAQTVQTGAVSANPGQPAGTTYAWTVSGAGKILSGSGTAEVTVGASGQSGSQGDIKVRLTYNFTDPSDPTLTGSATDDSEQTPPPGQSSADAAYYSFTAHRPTRLETYGTPAPIDTHQGPDYWSYAYAWSHQLFDQLGTGMPDVELTERFPDRDTQLADWNALYNRHITATDAHSTGLSWKSLEVGRHLGPDGILDNLDEIGLTNIAPVNGDNPALFGALVITHQYFACTLDTILNDWGLLVGNYTDSMSPTAVSHVKS
jgi:hypothetical protein